MTIIFMYILNILIQFLANVRFERSSNSWPDCWSICFFHLLDDDACVGAVATRGGGAAVAGLVVAARVVDGRVGTAAARIGAVAALN